MVVAVVVVVVMRGQRMTGSQVASGVFHEHLAGSAGCGILPSWRWPPIQHAPLTPTLRTWNLRWSAGRPRKVRLDSIQQNTFPPLPDSASLAVSNTTCASARH